MGSTPKPTQSSAASPAKGKAAATRKPPRRGVTKRTARKPPPKRGVRGKGRGRGKTFSDPRVQAAYERQRELRELFSTVSMAVKPALDEIADQSVKKLLEEPESYKETPEYLEVQQQLDAQLKQVIETADLELRTKLKIAERTYELESNRLNQSYQNSFDYATEAFLDGALNRASIIEELRREGCALDTPDLNYTYVEHIPYVPFENNPVAGLERQARYIAKRKAEGQPSGRGGAKKPRHTGALLASEKQPDGKPESNAPSPTPLDLDEQDPIFASKVGLPEYPAEVLEPDEFGVRNVFNWRLKKDREEPHNRYIFPQNFQWEDDEIGFRDSTNDHTRIIPKKWHERGIFLDDPNSRNFHFDHTIKDYDLDEYEDDWLDPELVKKHRLHPKLGFFMSNSTNEAEPPAQFVDGLRPVVYVPDRNTTAHTSRSVRLKKMDHMLKGDAAKIDMARILNAFCQEEDISADGIVTDEMRERERQARERLSFPSSDDGVSESSGRSPLVEAEDSTARECASLLLQAADHLEADKLALPPPSPRPSRPYDAVRDVFTSAEPAPAPTGQPSEDTHGYNPLAILADVSEDAARQRAQADTVATGTNDFAMIDPRILNQAPPPPNTFLQTALNPMSAFMRSAPAHPSSMDVAQQPIPAAPAAPARNPFTNQGIKDSPILPPLRPNRADGLGKASAIASQQPPLPPPAHRPQEFGSPRGLMHTNSGTFYPPAPSRPFHQGFAFHESPSMSGPIQGQPIAGPAGFANQPQMHPHHTMYPTLSPPPMHNASYMPSMAMQMEAPVPSVSPPIPPSTAPSPPINASRQRGSVSSNGNGSGKYRKIAAAPIPHNRSWSSNGGPELRLSHYDYKESIKDYRANETPPQSGPTTIRGWNVNNVSKGRNRGVKKEDSEEKESPK
ncbi:E1 ubiquitin-activating protein aos1 [Hypoxylon texense]